MNNTQVYTDKQKFRKDSIVLFVSDLAKKGISLTEEEKKLLIESYDKDSRDLNEIFKELQNINKDIINQRIYLAVSNQKPIENKISLDCIKDVYKEDTGKNYIIVHYPYPDDKKVKAIENLSGKAAKDIFESMKDSSGLVNVDGFVNSLEVFDQNIKPDKSEVNIKNVTELTKRDEYKKLTEEEQKIVYGVLVTIINKLAGIDDAQKQKLRKEPVENLITMLDKDVFIAPQENIVMICTPNMPSQDKIMSVKKNYKGEYELVSLNVKGYDFINNDNVEQTQEKTDDSAEKEDLTDEEKEQNKEKEEIYEEFGPKGTAYVKKKPKNDNRGFIAMDVISILIGIITFLLSLFTIVHI